MKRREKQEKEFKEELERLFQMIYNPVMAAAELGETKYLFDMKPWAALQQQQQHQRFQQQHQIEMNQLRQLGRNEQISKNQLLFNTQMHAYQQAQKLCKVQESQVQAETPSEELLAGLREKFPGCTVSVQEDWVETRQGVKELKKGIMIDWS